MANSTDISVGFKASANIEFVNASTDIEGSVTLNSKSSWENSTLSQRSMKNSRGITLTQPEVDGVTDKSYNYKTLVYITKNGGLKVAHATDPMGSASGREWWRKHYGGKPDAALNLPNRLVLNEDSQWVLNKGESYFHMRGIALTQDEYDKKTESYPYLTGGVDEGTKVRVQLDVYNFSVDTAARGVEVRFAYQELSDDLQPVGQPQVFATTQGLDLPARSVKQIAEVWDTTGRAGASGKPYRFVITLDTGGENEIHGNDPATGGNNKGVWPWGGSAFNVFKASARTASLEKGRQIIAPLVALSLRPAEEHMHAISDIAEVTVEMEADDPSIRHLVLVQPSREEDGIWSALASRTLWGLRKGRHVFRIPVAAVDLNARPMQAWLSPGGETVGPLRPTLSEPVPRPLNAAASIIQKPLEVKHEADPNPLSRNL